MLKVHLLADKHVLDRVRGVASNLGQVNTISLEIIQQYQPLLRAYEKDDRLILLHAEEERGTKAGENYMSVVLRTKVTGKRGDGSPYAKSFMRKKLLENSKYATFARNNELFELEAYVYKNVLPLLGHFGPDCILAEPREIIMEDLRSRNFSIWPKREMQDFNHCVAAVQTLASLHASSLALKLKSPEEFYRLTSHLTENVFPPDDKSAIGHFFEQSVLFASASLDSIEAKTERVHRAINFLTSYKGRVAESMRKLLLPQYDDERFWVITHGDTWNNNMMFLHDSTGNVVRVKLIDFQVMRHSSAALDLTYFLYSSAREEVLKNDMDTLIRTYEEYFMHDLRKLDAPERDLEALAKPGWFKRELTRYGLFGFLGALMVLHAIFMDESSAVEYEKNTAQEDFNPEEQSMKEIPLMPEKTERILFVVDHFIQNFVEPK
ncbi:hypothetical protein QAD02_014508 [Eretmocerus hayati]|uniref:Uncharacterized protein n=1 Tax=Eretmocerus hayati TaxID=131215 RepID=A0ACC2P6R4_9HYME|nr:hypothetical protein QAD02_014508 [Eretmocerus hayati]